MLVCHVSNAKGFGDCTILTSSLFLGVKMSKCTAVFDWSIISETKRRCSVFKAYGECHEMKVGVETSMRYELLCDDSHADVVRLIVSGGSEPKTHSC